MELGLKSVDLQQDRAVLREGFSEAVRELKRSIEGFVNVRRLKRGEKMWGKVSIGFWEMGNVEEDEDGSGLRNLELNLRVTMAAIFRFLIRPF